MWTSRLLLALTALAPLVFARCTLDAFTFNKAMLGQTAALLLVAVRLRWPRREPVNLGIGLTVLSAILSTIFSVSPRVSWQGMPGSMTGLSTVLSYVVVFCVARAALGNVAGARAIMRAGLVAAGATSAYALAQAFRLDPFGWQDGSRVVGFERPVGTMGHAILLGAYLAMTLPFALFELLQSRRRDLQIGWACLTLLMLVGLAVTLSRGAWLAALVGIGCHFAVYGSRRTWHIGGALALAGILLVGALALLQPSLATGITARLHTGLAREGRLSIWQTAWQTFLDHPVLGSGLDTFALVFGQHQTADYWSFESDAVPVRAHNEFLQSLATQGLLGASAIVLLAVGLGTAAKRRWVEADAQQRQQLIAAYAGLLALAVALQFGFAEPGCCTLAVCLAGSLAGSGRREVANDPPAPMWHWPLRVSIAGIAFWVGIGVPYYADCRCRAADSVRESDSLAAIATAEEAVRWAPDRALYWTKLAELTQAEAGKADGPERLAWLRRADAACAEAIRLVPADPANYANRARSLTALAMVQAAEVDDALAAFDAALARSPRNLLVRAQAGEAALALGRPKRARAYFETGQQIDPTYARFPLGLGALALAEQHWSEAVDRLDEATTREWYGDRDGWRRAPPLQAAAHLAFGDLPGAEYWARMAVRHNPDALSPHWILATTLERGHQVAPAVREYHLLLTLQPGFPPAQAALRRLESTP